MKTLLGVLGAFGLLATTGTSTVACGSFSGLKSENQLLKNQKFQLQDTQKKLNQEILELSQSLKAIGQLIDKIKNQDVKSLKELVDFFNKDLLNLTKINTNKTTNFIGNKRLVPKNSEELILVNYDENASDDEIFMAATDLKDVVTVPEIQLIKGWPTEKSLDKTLEQTQKDFVVLKSEKLLEVLNFALVLNVKIRQQQEQLLEVYKNFLERVQSKLL